MNGDRKHGNKARKPAFQRYWSRQKGYGNRAEMHRERNVARFEKMVLDSRIRHAPILDISPERL